MNNSNVLSALFEIPAADLSYSDWIMVGMALKHEGYPCSVWDEWSRFDSRYHPGECEKKWASFSDYSGAPVTGGSIVNLAKKYGFLPASSGPLDWDSEISYDGFDDFGKDLSAPEPKDLSPVEQLKLYLSLLFKPDEYVGYVTGDVWQTREGRFAPSKGVYNRTAAELLAYLDKYPNDLGATIGDWKSECGGWIRFNPLDGKGVKNENVTRFSYALVESDSMPLEEQRRKYRELNLPIACLVSSGGKSLHAIVHIDAKDKQEYRKRVDYLYDFLEEHGVTVDRQNSNPARLSRIPGVTRNGKLQQLCGINLGASSWQDWLESVKGFDDGLPAVEPLFPLISAPPQLPEELIQGVLRCGHKMLISGPSKAGKSFLLMELCIALAEGRPWLGFNCRKSRVLYVNLEIDRPSCINRFITIYKALGIEPQNAENICLWNLRGKAEPLDALAPKLIERMKDKHFDAVIIDPIYKVITGDENSASDMGFFCNQFDKICLESGASAIYCHHHSKGAQGSKKAQDRASGSGVFARDPDAQLDMIELQLSDEIKNFVRDGSSSAWRLEASLREFKTFEPVNFWFNYPLHTIDKENLNSAPATGSAEANLSKSSKRTTAAQRKAILENAFDICRENGFAKVSDISEYTDLTHRTILRYIREFPDEFTLANGIVTKK